MRVELEMFKRENPRKHSKLIQNGSSSKCFSSVMSWASIPRNDDLSDSIIQEFNTKINLCLEL